MSTVGVVLVPECVKIEFAVMTILWVPGPSSNVSSLTYRTPHGGYCLINLHQ